MLASVEVRPSTVLVIMTTNRSHSQQPDESYPLALLRAYFEGIEVLIPGLMTASFQVVTPSGLVYTYRRCRSACRIRLQDIPTKKSRFLRKSVTVTNLRGVISKNSATFIRSFFISLRKRKTLSVLPSSKTGSKAESGLKFALFRNLTLM
jgi:hypothetical protein